MDNEENKSLIKKDSAFVEKVGNQIAVTNKLISKTNERLAEEYYEKGNQCFQNDDFDSAICNYCKAIEINAQAHYYGFLGQVFFEIKEWNKAITNFTKALELEKSSAWYYWRALCYSDSERNNKAIEDFTNAINLETYTDTKCYFQRAQSYYALLEFENAIKDLDKCIEINPDHSSAQSMKEKYLKIISKNE